MEIEIIISVAITLGACSLVKIIKRNSTKTVQKNNNVNGDQAGRDINKTT